MFCSWSGKAYDFGVGYFGTDPGYGEELMQWIGKNYSPVQLVRQRTAEKRTVRHQNPETDPAAGLNAASEFVLAKNSPIWFSLPETNLLTSANL